MADPFKLVSRSKYLLLRYVPHAGITAVTHQERRALKSIKEAPERISVGDKEGEPMSPAPTRPSANDTRTILISAVKDQIDRLPAWFVGVLLLLGALGYLLREAMPLLLRAFGH